MGAILMCGFVIFVAIAGTIYFYLQDAKEAKFNKDMSRHAESVFSVTEGRTVIIDSDNITITSSNHNSIK